MTDGNLDPFADYRKSHARPGYGVRYSQTYRVGYYAKLWREIERPLLERRLVQLADKGVQSALDFACGTGRITRLLGQHFDRVLGVDVAESMLDVARAESGTVRYMQADITTTPLSEQFGVVTAFRFFLNAEPALRVAAMGAIRDLLIPGGWLIANIHVTESSPLGTAYRIRNWILRRTVAKTMSIDELVALGVACGFEVAHVDRYGLLPRIGRLSDGALLVAMMPAERVFSSVGFLPRRWAQAALVVFRRP